MKKICIHWTAGPYERTILDFNHYHFTVSWDGGVLPGKFKPEANIPPLRNGHYAAHCGGGNSWTIGVALRGMAGFRNAKNVGEYPLTDKQCEAAWKLCAELSLKYGIEVLSETVFTHYEFGKRNPGSDSAGKIDIIYLPCAPEIPPDKIGGYIRAKIKWYLEKIKEGDQDNVHP